MTQQMRPRLFVVNSGPVLRLSPELAMEIGLSESVVLLQVDYLISVYGHERDDGRLWGKLSIRELQRLCFPFWSIATISRTLGELVKRRLLLSDELSNGVTTSYSLGDGCADLHSVRLIGDYANTMTPVYGGEMGKPAQARPPKTSTKGKPANGERGINVYEAAVALAQVCQMELEPNKPRLLKEARVLNHDAQDILRLFSKGGPWYRLDFRGLKNSPPTPSQVRETWLKMEQAAPKVKSTTTPQGEYNV